LLLFISSLIISFSPSFCFIVSIIVHIVKLIDIPKFINDNSHEMST
jgi:hypothetical protein